MSPLFEELDYRPTPFGAVSLRRRRHLATGEDVYEIKLGEAFLMSSQFTVSEERLAQRGLGACAGERLDVVVGGLGLGYTAAAALDEPRLSSLIVVEALEAVIDWHTEGLVPLGARLTADPRCRLVQGDFFACAAAAEGFDPQAPGRRFDAILVDIDHAPEDWLAAGNAEFYSEAGLARLKRHMKAGAIFGLWSNERPDAAFTARLERVFAQAWAEEVRFHNSLQDREAVQSLYLARTQG